MSGLSSTGFHPQRPPEPERQLPCTILSRTLQVLPTTVVRADVQINIPVPRKFLKIAAMPIPCASPLRHTRPNKIFEKALKCQSLRGLHTLCVLRGHQPHGCMDLVPTRCFSFASFQIPCATLLRLTPSLRTSYFHSPASSCRKVIAHHEALIFLGTAVEMPSREQKKELAIDFESTVKLFLLPQQIFLK